MIDDSNAIGDGAAHSNAFADGTTIRRESVQNANDRAGTVAEMLAGQPDPCAAIPWFWFDHYDVKSQTIGMSAGKDAVIRGDPAFRAFSVVHLRNERAIALDCVNMVRDNVQGRALVASGATGAAEQVAGPAIPLKSVLQPSAANAA